MMTARRILCPLVAAAHSAGFVPAQHFEYKEHHLGPTGLFGVTSPTRIKITKVREGSPADAIDLTAPKGHANR